MKIITTNTDTIKYITIVSVCKTHVRILNDYNHSAITYEEYLQTMNDARHDYIDMIESFEDYELISREEYEELELYINLRFTE